MDHGKNSINFAKIMGLDISKIKHFLKIECYVGTTSGQL
jgi:hypothetical protein